MTDHRIGVSLQGVNRVLEGQILFELFESLAVFDEKQRLENLIQNLNSQ